MKRRIIFIFCILIFVILFSLIYLSTISKEKSLSSEKLDYINGMVTNIWIDSTSRLDTLKKHNIKYLFVDVGDTGKDGKIETNEKEIKEFLNFIDLYEQENNYTFILLPYSEINTYVYNVDPDFIKNFINDYINLVNIGFDGLLVDIEPVQFTQRDVYIDLLEQLNVKLPKSIIISVYAGSLGSSQNEWEWDYNFYKEVSENVDLISIPAYDTGLTGKEEYQNYIKEQIKRISSQNWNSHFLLAIPTHKEFPETIENALNAYKSEITKYPKNPFLGVSIFSEWTTTSDEWDIFEKFYDETRSWY